MLPIPKKLLEQGVRDMVRISDARMSGTAYGTCVLHVAPESFVGGPLALVQTGDLISLDVPGRRIDLRVSEEDLAARRSSWVPREFPATRGYAKLFARARHPGPPGLRLRLPPRRRRRPRARDPLTPLGCSRRRRGHPRPRHGPRTAAPRRRTRASSSSNERPRSPPTRRATTPASSTPASTTSRARLKAKLCAEGRDALYAYCDAHGVPYERCGKLIIALDDSELGPLDELERRGIENGVPGLRRLSAAEIPEIEPHAVGVAALHSPETGIIDFAAVARAMAREIQSLGATDPARASPSARSPATARPRSSPPARATSPPPARSRARASGPTAWPKPPATTRTRGSSPSEAATRSSSPKPATSSEVADLPGPGPEPPVPRRPPDQDHLRRRLARPHSPPGPLPSRLLPRRR